MLHRSLKPRPMLVVDSEAGILDGLEGMYDKTPELQIPAFQVRRMGAMVVAEIVQREIHDRYPTEDTEVYGSYELASKDNRRPLGAHVDGARIQDGTAHVGVHLNAMGMGGVQAGVVRDPTVLYDVARSRRAVFFNDKGRTVVDPEGRLEYPLMNISKLSSRVVAQLVEGELYPGALTITAHGFFNAETGVWEQYPAAHIFARKDLGGAAVLHFRRGLADVPNTDSEQTVQDTQDVLHGVFSQYNAEAAEFRERQRRGGTMRNDKDVVLLRAIDHTHQKIRARRELAA